METKEFKNLSVGMVVEYNYSGPMMICGVDNKGVTCNSIDEKGKYYVFSYNEKDCGNMEIIPETSWIHKAFLSNIDCLGYIVKDGMILNPDGSRPKMRLFAKFLSMMNSNKMVNRIAISLFFFVLNFLFFGFFVMAFDKLNFLGSWALSTLTVTLLGYLVGLVLYPVSKKVIRMTLDFGSF